MRAIYVMCIDNKAYPHDLTLHKVYEIIPDAHGAKFGDVRIVDDSGEDYLFPKSVKERSNDFGRTLG
jgi:hypothetical protein